MEENFEATHSSGDNRKNRNFKKSLTRSIISMVLLFFVVTAVFIIVNNRLSAVTNNTNGTETGSWISGGGSCCNTETVPNTEEQLAQSGLAYYSANFGDTEGLEATVDDFGCHQEVSILRGSEEVKRFSYTNGTFFDITP